MPRRWTRHAEPATPLLDQAGATTTEQRERVLAAIVAAGAVGLTRDALAESGIAPLQSICPAVLSLLRAGQVRESGERRHTRAGHSAAVLVAAGVAVAPAQAGDLVPRQIPVRPDRARARWEAAEAAQQQRRREAAAERIILAARRQCKTDDEIRVELSQVGLEWPR